MTKKNKNRNQNHNEISKLITKHHIFEKYPFVAVYSNGAIDIENLSRTVESVISIINKEVENFLDIHSDKQKHLNRLFYQKNDDSNFALPVYFANKSFFLSKKGFFYNNYLMKTDYFGTPNEASFANNNMRYREVEKIPKLISLAFSNYLKETPPDFETLPSLKDWDAALKEYKEVVDLKKITMFFRPLKKSVYFNNISFALDKSSKSHLLSNLRNCEKNPYVKSGVQSMGNLKKCKHVHFNLSGNDISCNGCGASMTYSKADKAWKPNLQSVEALQALEKAVDVFTPILESFFEGDAIHFLEKCITLSSSLKAAENKKIRSTLDQLKNIIRNLNSLYESTTLPLEQKRMVHFVELLLAWTKNKQSVVSLFEKESFVPFLNYYQTAYIEKVNLWLTDNSNCLNDLLSIKNEWQVIYDNAMKQSAPSSFTINHRLIFLSKDTKTLLSLVNRLDMDFGVTTIVDVLKGSKNQKMKEYNLTKNEEYGAFADFKKDDIKDALYYFIEKDVIRQEGDKYPKIGLTKKGKLLVNQYKNLNTDEEETLEAESANEIEVFDSNAATMPATHSIKEEEQKFYKVTLNEFFERLTMPNLPTEWVTNYLEKHHEAEGKAFYRKVVEVASNQTKLIPFVENFLIDNYDEVYQPIFRMYLKTKTGLWKELVTIILDKNNNNLAK